MDNFVDHPILGKEKGMLIPLTVVLCLGSSVSAKFCADSQFWSALNDKCITCSKCISPDVVITPCQGHRDTRCGPLSDLKIDWSWMNHGRNHVDEEKAMTDTFKENMKEIRQHEMHVKEKETFLKKLQNRHNSLDASEGEEVFFGKASKEKIWRKLKSLQEEDSGAHKARVISDDPTIIDIPEDWPSPHFTQEEAQELMRKAPKVDSIAEDPNDEKELEFDENEVLKKNFGMFPVEEDEIRAQDMGELSTTEKFVLDWQTGVLAMAVAACLVFFLIISCYSLCHIRYWKTIQSYVGKDAEEFQIWLTPKKSSQQPPSSIYKTTTEVIHKDNARHCKYLERIITKNAKKFNRVPGNVYQGAHPSIETRPLTAEDPKNISI